MSRPLSALAVACALATPLLFAPVAEAGWTTYWPTPVAQVICDSSNATGLGSHVTARRNNYGYNRRYSHVYANGGSWTWGAFYATGGSHSATSNQVGAWHGALEINNWSTQQTDPFITNNNGSTVGAAGCFLWI